MSMDVGRPPGTPRRLDYATAPSQAPLAGSAAATQAPVFPASTPGALRQDSFESVSTANPTAEAERRRGISEAQHRELYRQGVQPAVNKREFDVLMEGMVGKFAQNSVRDAKYTNVMSGGLAGGMVRQGMDFLPTLQNQSSVTKNSAQGSAGAKFGESVSTQGTAQMNGGITANFGAGAAAGGVANAMGYARVGAGGISAGGAAEAWTGVQAGARAFFTNESGMVGVQARAAAEAYGRAVGEFKAGPTGVSAKAAGQVGVSSSVQADVMLRSDGAIIGNKRVGGLNAEVKARAATEVMAAGAAEVSIKAVPPGLKVEVGGEAFAGARAGVLAKANFGGMVGVSAEIEGYAGVGVMASGKAEMKDGKLELGFNIGAALGVGVGIKAGVEVDFKKISELGTVTGKELLGIVKDPVHALQHPFGTVNRLATAAATTLHNATDIAAATATSTVKMGATLLEGGAQLVAKSVQQGIDELQKKAGGVPILAPLGIVVGAAAGVVSTVAQVASATVGAVMEIGKTAVQGVLKVGTSVVSGLTNTFKALAKGDLKGAGQAALTGLKETGKAIVNTVVNVGKAVVEGAKKIGTAFVDGVKKIGQGIADGFKNMGNAIANLFKKK